MLSAVLVLQCRKVRGKDKIVPVSPLENRSSLLHLLSSAFALWDNLGFGTVTLALALWPWLWTCSALALVSWPSVFCVSITGWMRVMNEVMLCTPDVMTTDWNRSNTGLMAIDASKQLKFIIGFDIVGVRSSNGSIIRTNPANIQHNS